MAVSRRGIEEAAIDPVPFGRYVLLGAVAEGRIGTVHRACLAGDGPPDKLFAIKRVALDLSRDASFAERFDEVMARAAELEHPAHCAIEDIGRARDGSLYAAMPLVPGKDLGRIADMLHERGVVMPAPLLAYVGSRIADALEAAHAMSYAGKPTPLYHGELAPADILIGYDGAVCLTGLGSVALQSVSPDPAPRYGYRAPELDQGICNAQSDVFSLGACLSELLTGRPAARIEPLGENRRPHSHITRVVPPALEQIVRRALAADPAARWQSAAELSDALQRWGSTQTARADDAALAEFMHGLFEAVHELEATRLEACLARLAATRPHSASAPASLPAAQPQPNYPQLVRASESARARTPVRAPGASAAPQRGKKAESWTEPSEQTPARGVLMQELAAEMVGAERSQQPTPKSVPDNPWDDESPAERWISEGEEREALEWRMPARKPGTASLAAAPLVAPARAAAAQPLSVPPLFAAVRPAHAPWLVPALAGGALLAVVATVAVFHNARSAPRPDPLPTTPPTRTSVTSRPEPINAGAAATDLDLQQQLARTQVAEPAAPQATRALDESGSGSDRERTRRRRAVSERTPSAAEPAASEATTEANTDSASPAPAAFGPTTHHEPASTAAEQPAAVASVGGTAPALRGGASVGGTAPALRGGASVGGTAPALRGGASVRARPESIAATAPAAEPIVKAIAPAPRTAVAPAAQAPAASATRGPSHAAVLVERTTPRLSARARRIGITEGVALVELTIDANGAVTNANVLKAEPPEILEGVSLKAVREWRYQPALANGTAVESRQRVTIRFAE